MTSYDNEGHVVFMPEDIPWMKDFIEEMRTDGFNRVADLMATELEKIKVEPSF